MELSQNSDDNENKKFSLPPPLFLPFLFLLFIVFYYFLLFCFLHSRSFKPLFRVRSLAADTTIPLWSPAVLPHVVHCRSIAVLGSLLSSILYKWALQ
jgi:hypothetical protein